MVASFQEAGCVKRSDWVTACASFSVLDAAMLLFFPIVLGSRRQERGALLYHQTSDIEKFSQLLPLVSRGTASVVEELLRDPETVLRQLGTELQAQKHLGQQQNVWIKQLFFELKKQLLQKNQNLQKYRDILKIIWVLKNEKNPNPI